MWIAGFFKKKMFLSAGLFVFNQRGHVQNLEILLKWIFLLIANSNILTLILQTMLNYCLLNNIYTAEQDFYIWNLMHAWL